MKNTTIYMMLEIQALAWDRHKRFAFYSTNKLTVTLCEIAALAHKLINNWQFCKLSLVFNNSQYLLNSTNAYKQCSVRFYLQLFVVGLMRYLRHLC